MLNITKDLGSLTKALVWLCAMVGGYKYDQLYSPRTVRFDVCGKEEDFAKKFESEAEERKLRGYAVRYNSCCVKGEIEAERDALFQWKDWITTNSTPPVEKGRRFREEKATFRFMYNNFSIDDEENQIRRT